MAFKLNGNPLATGVPFRTANGTLYPSNWLKLSTAEEKAAIGITEVADPVPIDNRFFKSDGSDKSLVDYTVTTPAGETINQKGLKNEWIAYQKSTANGLLAKYDWYIVRNAEKSIAIPSAVTTYRDSVRSTCVTREGEINAAANATALQQLVTGGLTDWPNEP